MPKLKTLYICQQCGSQSVKWAGRCTGCDGWNTFVEEVVEQSSATSASDPVALVPPTLLADVLLEDAMRVRTGIGEFDRVLGGGIVPGSITLVGGEPGIGKSTLLLQLAIRMKRKILYISGEES